jgi:hypothetical protein
MSEDNKISFERLYDEDKLPALNLFLVWTNDWLEGANIDYVTIDFDRAWRFVANLQKSDFPAYGGYEKASPFKKAAWMYVLLHTESPFVGALSKEVVGDLAKLSHSTTSLIGLSMVRECLHGANLAKNGSSVNIENPINVSNHFLLDLVEASGRITLNEHFRTFSLLFEALAYEANPGLSYPKVL